MTSRTRCLAALAAVALAGAACSKLPATSSTATTAAPTTTIPGSATPAQTKAADYRAQLTYLMSEHVFLLARVTAQVVSGAASAPGVPASSSTAATTTSTVAGAAATTTTVAAPQAASSPATTGAPAGGASHSSPAASGSSSSSSSSSSTTTSTSTPASTPSGPVHTSDDAGTALDLNSHDIADLLARAQGYGSEFGSSFYELWTQRIDDIAAYAAAKAAKDTKATKAATDALGTNATDIGTLVHQSNKYIAVTTVKTDGLADELGTDNTAVTTFIDAQVANDSGAIGDVITTIEGGGAGSPGMAHTATVLAAGAAKLDPDQFPGTATGTAANLRAGVTMALVEHVQLAGLTIDQLVKGGAGGPERAALAGNTGKLANIVTVNFGDPAARAFTTLWARYVSDLEAYASAKSGSGSAPDLSSVGSQVGAFFAQQTSHLSASTLGADTQKVVDALKGYADTASSSGQAIAQLRVAAAAVPKLASDLSEGIAENKPTLYLP